MSDINPYLEHSKRLGDSARSCLGLAKRIAPRSGYSGVHDAPQGSWNLGTLYKNQRKPLEEWWVIRDSNS
ncbi:hypothetical protein [Rhodovulum sulfidophilum]|uniref:Uncharacterized protein n=1 Tax=Rhodovulum sulfidophilum TaxID=35806 RepID=A0ABS1RX20_RHOSU|nr:hypothetical protein [Rhodovulum sulfidophilum]MBL3610634.1 hypothetical protein [Rhodovulum sulfidophilum]MCE8457152.1 hypothetical protein [Rhodovulum sulfidophilum]